MRNHKQHEINPFNKVECEVSIEVLDTISELSKTALRIYKYLNKYGYKSEGVIHLNRKELKFELSFRENKSIYNGLSELLNKDILAAGTEKDCYFYNPQYIEE